MATQKRFVLVVEDDDDIRETFELILHVEGYEVLSAADGEAALAILEAHRDEIGIILLDLLMPNMDGWQFLEARSKSDELEEVPTIVLSAGTHPTNPISAHATAFLMKPVGVQELVSCVRKYSNITPLPERPMPS